MKKFIVLYMAPAAGLEEWMKVEEETRIAEERKMQDEWNAWMKEHGAAFTGITAGTGKTKRIDKNGVSDVKNDIMLCSIIEAESHEDAAALFLNHPHFGIPNGWIEVMPLNPLPGMEG